MAILMRIWNLMGSVVDPDHEVQAALERGEPIWLKAFDVDAHDGGGFIRFTDHPADAMRFADLEVAFEAWKTQSKVRPLRADGKPNRPLTAFSITFDPAPDQDDASAKEGLTS